MIYRLSLVCLIAFFSCTSNPNLYSEAETSVPSHVVFSKLLQKHVDSTGLVNYKGFLTDKTLLENYLMTLDSFPPTKNWPEDEQKAYWINVYNAATIELILENYPLKSIRDLHPTPYIPFVNTVWHIQNITIGGKKGSLDQIEHEILRPRFNDPRVHFAINCASFSCPRLRNEAYTAEKLENQLIEQTTSFINNPDKNTLSEKKVEISPIFSWFSDDFKEKGSIIQYINTYSDVKIDDKAEISYKEYDWRLNAIHLNSVTKDSRHIR